ncbi:hypothetical protein RB201_32670 [Streptomyces sp. S1A(2023)]
MDRAITGKYGILAARFHVAGEHKTRADPVHPLPSLVSRHRAWQNTGRYVPVHRTQADPSWQAVDPLGEHLHVGENPDRHDSENSNHLMRNLSSLPA